MNAKDLNNITEAYHYIISEAPTPITPTTAAKPAITPTTAAKPAITPTTAAKPAPSLSDLRTAAAQATMAGPSREAQALMSPRAKAILGQQGKLQAGSQAQDKVAQMRSSMPSATSTPRAAINPEWAKANPKLAAAEMQRRETSGTSATKNPMITQDMKSRMPTPAPKAQTPTAPTAPTKPQQSTSPTLSQQQQDLYKQAYQNRNNPFAKGRIQSELNKMTPEQRKMFQQYAQSQGQGNDWSNYKFESHHKTFSDFISEAEVLVEKHLGMI